MTTPTPKSSAALTSRPVATPTQTVILVPQSGLPPLPQPVSEAPSVSQAPAQRSLRTTRVQVSPTPARQPLSQSVGPNGDSPPVVTRSQTQTRWAVTNPNPQISTRQARQNVIAQLTRAVRNVRTVQEADDLARSIVFYRSEARSSVDPLEGAQFLASLSQIEDAATARLNSIKRQTRRSGHPMTEHFVNQGVEAKLRAAEQLNDPQAMRRRDEDVANQMLRQR